MKPDFRNAVVVVSMFATIALAGCADLQAMAGDPPTCVDSATWFERQRQMVDGHADPHDAAIDHRCRPWERDERQGDLYGSGD